jgi:selenocysteine lyase/cysteine desulfurase
MLDEHRNFTRRKKNIIYERNTVCTTFGHRKSVYCDFIASGLASKFVEDYIKDNIFLNIVIRTRTPPMVSVKTEISDTRDVIKTEYGLDDSYEILFKGFGSTDCINFLLNCFRYSKYCKISFISMYEH